MKHLMIIAILASFFSLSAFAQGEGESTTECPMMREMNKRINTKANLSKEVKKPAKPSGSTAVEG
jgi:hypothetical protein